MGLAYTLLSRRSAQSPITEPSFMTRTLTAFVALFTSFALLLTGGGLLGTLVSVRMTLEWFPNYVIGMVVACYSVGFVLATRVCGRVIQSVGHIRTFAVLAVLAATSTLIYPLIIDPVAWGLVRMIYGFSIAGLYMVTESWLNDRTPREYRGQILGVYSVVTYLGLGGGQFLLMVGDAGGYALFSVASILLGLALVPVSLTRYPSPQVLEVAPVRLRHLIDISPLGAVGSAIAGMINGTFLGLGPVFAHGSGFTTRQVSILMGATILGGFLLQWPIGRLSDLYDRRRTIMTVSLAVAVCCGAIVVAAGKSMLAVFGLSVLWGGLAFTVYPLSLALANDFVQPSELLGAGAGLLLLHGLGMVFGPIITSAAMQFAGPEALYYGMGAFALLLAGFAKLRDRVGPELTSEEHTEYRYVPRNTPWATALDPRYGEVQLELDFGDEFDDYRVSQGVDMAGQDSGAGGG